MCIYKKKKYSYEHLVIIYGQFQNNRHYNNLIIFYVFLNYKLQF